MNNQEFMGEVNNSYHRSVKVLREKEEEYAVKDNRLGQFYEVGKLSGENSCRALIGMAAKHFTSIMSMARDPHLFSIEDWNEKITDLRNYTFLLDALLRDIGIK